MTMNLTMLKFKNVILITLVFCTALAAQNAESHAILNTKLKKSSFKKIVKAAEKADVIFFGEMHDDPISHWLELKLLKELESLGKLKLGMEMMERDIQGFLNEYLQGNIDLENLEMEARLWNNYKTDYAPLVTYAKENKIDVVATNIPRRYATMVYKQGFQAIESLVEEEKAYIAPLPIPYDPELPGYKKMMDMVEGHGGENFPKAQAIKDATMAYSIAEAMKDGEKMLHLNGRYHSDNYEGIIWYLKRYAPDLKVLTISSRMSGEDEEKGIADFIIRVDEDMTKTY